MPTITDPVLDALDKAKSHLGAAVTCLQQANGECGAVLSILLLREIEAVQTARNHVSGMRLSLEEDLGDEARAAASKDKRLAAMFSTLRAIAETLDPHELRGAARDAIEADENARSPA
jgi:hypothetical protein